MLDFLIRGGPPPSFHPTDQLLSLMLKRLPVRIHPSGTQAINPPLICPGKDPQTPKKGLQARRRAIRTLRTPNRTRKPLPERLAARSIVGEALGCSLLIISHSS